MEKDKKLINTLKEFKDFYKKALKQCKKDKKSEAHLVVVKQKIKDIEYLIKKYL